MPKQSSLTDFIPVRLLNYPKDFVLNLGKPEQREMMRLKTIAREELRVKESRGGGSLLPLPTPVGVTPFFLGLSAPPLFQHNCLPAPPLAGSRPWLGWSCSTSPQPCSRAEQIDWLTWRECVGHFYFTTCRGNKSVGHNGLMVGSEERGTENGRRVKGAAFMHQPSGPSLLSSNPLCSRGK